MPRSHPPTLLTLTRATLRAEKLVASGGLILVAVSGGPDSMALLHVLARLRGALGFTLVAHGVDHGLRDAAATELDVAGAFAASLEVPFTRTRVAVARGGNLQSRARDARYEALRAAAGTAGADVIATAHHADDRAETILLRLLRGAGPTGLAVLPPRAGDLVRPFIRARRTDVLAHVARHALPFATDPSNEDPRFARTRVRRELLPLLEQLSPSIVTHLVSLADQLAEELGEKTAMEALGTLASDDFSQIAAVSGASLPRATRTALATLEAIRSPKMRVTLPGGLVAAYDRTQARVVIARAPARESAFRPRKG